MEGVFGKKADWYPQNSLSYPLDYKNPLPKTPFGEYPMGHISFFFLYFFFFHLFREVSSLNFFVTNFPVMFLLHP